VLVLSSSSLCLSSAFSPDVNRNGTAANAIIATAANGSTKGGAFT